MLIISIPVPDNWLFILGPTASGKSDIAHLVAKHLDGEIICMDSTVVYKFMDIGTAKPSTQQRQEVRYHLVDIIEPSEVYSAGRFVEDATRIASEIEARGKVVIFEGATYLYYKALVYGIFKGPSADYDFRKKLQQIAEKKSPQDLYDILRQQDPVAASKIHPHDLKRITRALEVIYKTGKPISTFHKHDQPRIDTVSVVINRQRKELVERIAKRVEAQIQAGLIDEVRMLLSYPGGWHPEPAKAVAYRETIEYIKGKYDIEMLKKEIIKDNLRLVRKQLAWMKKFKEAIWIDVAQGEPDLLVAKKIIEFYNSRKK